MEGKKMDRFSLKGFALAVGLIVGLASAGGAFEGDNASQSVAPANVTIPSNLVNRGVVFYTAAINADGTIAGCFNCVAANTLRLSTGRYQVDFGKDIRAISGFSRWVQPDPLNASTEFSWCDTADRAGDNNAIFINCQTTGGPGSMGNFKAVDTSFFLFVAR
jgi:hypothetical protein